MIMGFAVPTGGSLRRVGDPTFAEASRFTNVPRLLERRSELLKGGRVLDQKELRKVTEEIERVAEYTFLRMEPLMRNGMDYTIYGLCIERGDLLIEVNCDALVHLKRIDKDGTVELELSVRGRMEMKTLCVDITELLDKVGTVSRVGIWRGEQLKAYWCLLGSLQE